MRQESCRDQAAITGTYKRVTRRALTSLSQTSGQRPESARRTEHLPSGSNDWICGDEHMPSAVYNRRSSSPLHLHPLLYHRLSSCFLYDLNEGSRGNHPFDTMQLPAR
jgi:hypothetical protein